MQGELFRSETYTVGKKIRLIELFGGIGSQAMALRDIGADFEHYRLVEFDRFAVASYNAIHGTNFIVSDIRNVHGVDLGIERRNEFTYLLTYSFPCTDLSVAGKMKGMTKGSGTRSGLLWEVERILNELGDDLPDILLMENVPQVHSGKNQIDFYSWMRFLQKKGYSNFYRDMNAKDYGTAQSRNRCFMVSILGEYDYSFPEEMKLKRVLKDYLESDVEDKYFIRSEKVRKLIINLVERGVLPEQNRTEQRWQIGIDLSSCSSGERKTASAILARYSKGMCNHRDETTGVAEFREDNIR